MVNSLRRLREQIVKANHLVQEACFISEELERHTEYKVTLQIPSDNLNANRKVTHTHIHTQTHVNILAYANLHLMFLFFVFVCVFREMLCSVSQQFRCDDVAEGNRSGVWRRWRTVWWT